MKTETVRVWYVKTKKETIHLEFPGVWEDLEKFNLHEQLGVKKEDLMAWTVSPMMSGRVKMPVATHRLVDGIITKI
jgi:hypothetical protein